jgi:hypothetical protein
MSTERLALPAVRPVLEMIQKGELSAALRTMLEALRHKLPQPDTSIAWEDGESDREREARR